MNECFKNPLTAERSLLCQLNLVFAIGLALYRPVSGNKEDDITKELCANSDINRGEEFFKHAKRLRDPTSEPDDAELWTVQALILMVFYMLCICKRNTAYKWHGKSIEY
jgi:hypothetical protein